MPTLPRPDVNVTTTSDPEVIDVVISRDGGSAKKSYQGRGSSETARTKDAIKQILDDGYSAEWLPEAGAFC